MADVPEDLANPADVPAPTPEQGDPVFTSVYWKQVAERAIKTFAQTMIAALGIGQTGLVQVSWPSIGALSAAAALASVLTSISGLTAPQPPADEDTPAGQ